MREPARFAGRAPSRSRDFFGVRGAATGVAGQPAELAPAFVFVALQESSYITGETIVVTGGRLFG